MRYLSFNFKQEINWQQLSQDFQLPLRSLQRMVKEKLGITPQQYVNKLRLSYVYYQLKYSEKAIIEIALESGFSDSSYFSSCFKHEFGYCPRELR
ncbi:helix-turn-helix domain-containing protein [Lonepinella sp. BR2882]|uniref:helix-turn-helix domain-containing protein n=1 Tax=Lonepinella sp. BR2882 TaxID=3095283 RepID=UPI003F6E04D4